MTRIGVSRVAVCVASILLAGCENEVWILKRESVLTDLGLTDRGPIEVAVFDRHDSRYNRIACKDIADRETAYAATFPARLKYWCEPDNSLGAKIAWLLR